MTTKAATTVLRLLKHKEKAEELVKKDVEDYLVYTALSMECFQATNSLIELAELVSYGSKLEYAGSYKELFDILHKAGKITKKAAEDCKRLVHLRNLIAHEYSEITSKEVASMVKLLSCAEEIIAEVRKLQEKE